MSVDNKSSAERSRSIPNGWVETTLGEVCLKIGSGSTPRGGNEAYKKEGISLIRSQNILDFDFSYNGLAFIDDEQASKLSNVEIFDDDVLINITGDSVARVCSVPKEVLPARVNQHVSILRTVKQELNPTFLKYYLLNPIYKRYLLILANSGGTRNALTKSMLEMLELTIPPIKEQTAIAKILTAFDDKIENLQAQNKTLETTAQTIFKEWFGKYQIGDELPDGWRVGKLGEVIEFINGYAFKSKDLLKEPTENTYKVFKMGDIKKGGGFNQNKTKSYFKREDAMKLSKYILKNGDLLMSMTDMKDAISLLGHTALMIYDNEYIVNQRVGLIRVKNDINIDYPFLYLLTNDKHFIANLRGRANSGVQVNLSTQSIKESQFIIPNKETNIKFDAIAKPLFEKRKHNYIEIKTLKNTRDTLLPKLMSGSLRVKMSEL
ncbi:MAG: restriction endonuclease subunit S [Polaribacter sp.]|uniref:restriction endonuclease subunit S n=1 Tax=Polaribacter sp. TaxID=1920175 RepID=UPI002F354D79